LMVSRQDKPQQKAVYILGLCTQLVAFIRAREKKCVPIYQSLLK